jgi:hypothetical protein
VPYRDACPVAGKSTSQPSRLTESSLVVTHVTGECKPFKLRVSRVRAAIHCHLSSFLQAFRRRSFFPPSIVAGELKSLERINPSGGTKRVSRSLGQVRLGPQCRSPRARSPIPPRTPSSPNATRVATVLPRAPFPAKPAVEPWN